MDRILVVISCMLVLWTSALVQAVEVAPRITDREIIERLTRLEEGQNTLRAEIRANAEAIQLLRADMAQLRQDLNVHFDRIEARFGQIEARFGQIEARFGQMTSMMMIIVLAFAGVVASTIGFAIWDRRTMIRPFESKVRAIEEELSHNRQRLHALLEALRAVSQTDERVAEVLRRFQLL